VPIITEHPATAIIFVGSQLTIVLLGRRNGAGVGNFLGISWDYPLVNKQFAIENGHL
jgi:hypothetical protein